MTTICAKDLHGVPVVTRLGQKVGRVEDVELDVLTGKLAFLHVQHARWAGLAGARPFLVPWSAIIEIAPKQVTISDASVPETASLAESLATPSHSV